MMSTLSTLTPRSVSRFDGVQASVWALFCRCLNSRLAWVGVRSQGKRLD
jgi:hypothetical protein